MIDITRIFFWWADFVEAVFLWVKQFLSGIFPWRIVWLEVNFAWEDFSGFPRTIKSISTLSSLWNKKHDPLRLSDPWKLSISPRLWDIGFKSVACMKWGPPYPEKPNVASKTKSVDNFEYYLWFVSGQS